MAELLALLVALSAALAALWLLRYPRYRVGHKVWTVGAESEVLAATVTTVLTGGYILSIPAIALKSTSEFYISKRHARSHLYPRKSGP